MTLTQLKIKANQKLLEFWDALIIKQERYFLKHGKFFQLLITDPVVDGADTTWVLRKPNDEKHAVDVDFEFNSPIPFQISVDEWVGGDTGFSVTCIVELPNGDRYTRSRSAVPVIQTEQIDDNGVITIPRSISDWIINTTAWELVIPSEI